MELNKIINGDCLEVLSSFPAESVDCVITDPPYGVTQNEWDKVPDLVVLWKELWRVLKPDGAVVMTTQQPFTTDLINSERENFRYDLIWYKPLATGFLNANRMPLRNHEIILVFYRKLPTYNPQKFLGKIRTAGKTKANSTTNYGKFESVETQEHNDYFPQSVFEISNADKGEIEHPTQKPLNLMKYLVETYSNKDDLILDPFAGSGSTLVAAKELKRNFLGIEIDKEYCKIAEERLRNTRQHLF